MEIDRKLCSSSRTENEKQMKGRQEHQAAKVLLRLLFCILQLPNHYYALLRCNCNLITGNMFNYLYLLLPGSTYLGAK